ncbi:MAG: porin family protein [Bacteroidetes bacterium]|nr:porin family protein [Bacteroidota bacterium]
MKKTKALFIALCMLFLLPFSVWTQNRLFKKGQLDANFSIGLLPTFLADNGKVILLPISVSADYRIADKFSMGLYAGKSITETKRTDIQDCPNAHWKNSFTTIGWRGSIHFTEREKFDIYGGFLLIYNHSKVEIKDEKLATLSRHLGIKPRSGTLTYSGFIGSRYALGKNLSLYGEIGYGISLISLGVSYRLL